jgi:hypothetical protein
MDCLMKAFIAVMLCANTLAAQVPIDEFQETFDGTGEFSSNDGRFTGFDNPDWYIYGNGEFKDGGFSVIADPIAGTDTGEGTAFIRPLFGRGSFVQRVEIKDVVLGTFDPMRVQPTSHSRIFWEYHLDQRLNPKGDVQRLAIWVGEVNANSDDWLLGIRVGEETMFHDVSSGPHLAFEIGFDDRLAQATLAPLPQCGRGSA